MKTAVKHLKPHPFNAEIYHLSGIEDLAASIEQVGLLEPLVVNTKNQVISGHRRLRAIKQLEWKCVEVILRKDIPQDNEAFYLGQYNQQRIKLDSEQVKEILVLMDYYKQGPGKRTDLTGVHVDRGSAKSKVTPPHYNSRYRDQQRRLTT